MKREIADERVKAFETHLLTTVLMVFIRRKKVVSALFSLSLSVSSSELHSDLNQKSQSFVF